jgi:hypothetical protein
MERTPPRLNAESSQAPVQQAETVEILCSNERSGITPLFGTTVPPSGTSGKLRQFAFKFSENDLRHWLVLLLADIETFGKHVLPAVTSSMRVTADGS